MSRLINNKGTWQLEINKDDHKTLFSLFGNTPRFIEVVEENDQTLVFEFFHDWDYGGMEHCDESDYRQTLSKISENPDPDLIIPRVETPKHNRLIHQEEIMKNLLLYPKERNMIFLESLGIESPDDPTKFKWDEDNKLNENDV